MHKRLIFYISFIFLIPKIVVSQQPQVIIDSLLQVLSTPHSSKEGIYNNIGQNYFIIGQYDIAMKYYIKDLNYIDKNNSKQSKGSTYNAIGNIYLRHQKDYHKALEYFTKALGQYKMHEKLKGIALSYNNIGITYLSMDKFEEATNYLIKSYDIKYEINDTASIFTTLNNIGELYYIQKNYNKAIKYYQKSLSANNSSDWSYSNTLNNCGKYYIHMNNFTLAKSYLSQAIQVATKNDFKHVLKESFQLSTVLYSKKNKIDSLKKYNELYLSISDSLFSEKKINLLTEFQIKYETAEKEKENDLLKVEKELKNEKIISQKKYISILFISILVAIIFLLIILYQLIKHQKANRILVDKNYEIVEREKELEILHLSLENKLHHLEKNKITEKKYSNSELKDENKKDLIKSIETLIFITKSHLNTGFTIKDMATEINSSRTFVSQIINENYNCNFNTFINKYRIKEATRLLSDSNYSNITIEAISNLVGFKSKSSFNIAFKQYTGITPSYFIKTLQQSKV